MPAVKYNKGLVAQLGADVRTAGAQTAEVRREFTQQRARLDPNFTGAGAEKYMETQATAEKGLQELSDGMTRLGQVIDKVLNNAISTDIAGAGVF